MYKNRIEHITPALSLKPSNYAENLKELLEQTNSVVQEENYSVDSVSHYIYNLLGLLSDGSTTHYSLMPQISQNLIDMLAYINATCASEEPKSDDFAFTKGDEAELWELAQKADEIEQDIKLCTTQDDLDKLINKKVKSFKERVELTRNYLGNIYRSSGMDEFHCRLKDNEMSNIIFRLDQSIGAKVKELSSQKKGNRLFFGLSF